MFSLLHSVSKACSSATDKAGPYPCAPTTLHTQMTLSREWQATLHHHQSAPHILLHWHPQALFYTPWQGAHMQQPLGLLDSWTRTHRWGLTQPYTLAPWTLEGFQRRGKISATYPNYVKCVTVKPHIRISWEQSGTGIAENRSKTAFRDPW